jgi:membrane protein implicated in regulation of membrane protease activity
MDALEALYLQDPFWIWLALAGFFVALNLAAGSNLLIWPAGAAAVVATLEALGAPLGPKGEAGVFLGLLAVVGAVALVRMPRAVVAATDPASNLRPSKQATGRPEQTGRLVGRIARSTGEFANGVGRVWIDGAEWAAELDGAETLADGQPVRVVKVIGGVRLQVHPLDAG